MAVQDDEVEFELTENLLAKMDFAPGVPDDPDAVPRLYYQALLGNVYTLQRWPNGSTVRGEVPLKDLEALVGGAVREGWYSASGAYLGSTVELD